MSAVFANVAGTPLWALTGEPEAVVAAFVPADPAAAPSTLTLADTQGPWPGTVVFLPCATALDAGLGGRVQAFIGAHAPTPSLLWVPAPATDPATWNAVAVAIAAGTTTGLAGVPAGSLALWIGAGCTVALDPAGDALVLTPPAPPWARLTAGAGAASWSTAGTPVTLPLAGAQTGCLTTSITLDTSASGGDLDRLDVGLRVFTPGPATALLQDRLASWRFPVFVPGGTLPVQVSIDPLAPTAPGRTQLGLVPPGADSGPELGSYYTTTNGLAVGLTPLPEPPAALVPAVRALSAVPAASDPLYLVPSGAFGVTVRDGGGTAQTGPQQLACGTSGLEYVTLAQPGSQVWFQPGGPALATSHGLEDTATTAYAAVFGPEGEALTYNAQPDSAATFAPSGDQGVLRFLELAGQRLPDSSAPAWFPMAPFAGVADADAATHAAVELTALAPARRRIVGGASEATRRRPPPRTGQSGPTVVATTPQGLVGEFVDGVLSTLDMIRTQAGAHVVTIADVSPALGEALQSSQLFLVVSDPTALGTSPAVDWTVSIPALPGGDATEQWTFDAGGPADWQAHETLLIVKHAGKALETLAADTSAWTAGAAFNGGTSGVAAAQRVLLAAIATAREHADAQPPHPEFLPFLELIADDRWQGVLLINCAMPLAALPSQLAGLAAGIVQSAFTAHHVGLTLTPVTEGAGGALAQSDSSVFGLIAYASPTTAAASAGPYAFVVASLLVRFANSAVVDFASDVDLLVDELFGDPVTLEAADADVLTLRGVYQQQGGASAYTFSTTADNRFKATSGVLDVVDVASAQFVTVVPPGAGQAVSAFLLSGSIAFLEPTGDPTTAFDLFSYAPLAYANLRIEIGYTPGDPTKDVYTFDAAKVSLDPARSATRDQSLFASFPLTPTALVQVPASGDPSPATPKSLGFAGVAAPVGQGVLSAPWFGIVSTLGLGSAGALAAEAGFQASLLTAWAPGSPTSPNVAVALKLPGTGSGGKLLSLESVLKLKIGDLELTRAGDGTYVLSLDRITLSVLVLTFPPSGQLTARLFADPTGKDHTTLGWFAGYADPKAAS